MEPANLSNIGTVKNVINKYGFQFSKSLGQNFIINKSICPRMAKECVSSADIGVIEVGPGIGALTLELAKLARKVVAVELDKRLIPILSETTADFKNIKVINADILKTDLNALIKSEFAGFKTVNICANLPYYITSQVIMHLLEGNFDINSIVVMVQKEAAERICAKPGTRESGAISLAVRYYSGPKILFHVSKGSFMPAPNVDSSVIKIDVNKSKYTNIKDKEMFFKLVKAAFGKRRKTILNALSSGLDLPKEDVKLKLSEANIAENSRAEQLSFEDFAVLTSVF